MLDKLCSPPPPNLRNQKTRPKMLRSLRVRKGKAKPGSKRKHARRGNWTREKRILLGKVVVRGDGLECSPK
jgi:hypothetical protein